jgi:hypothetical protein
MILEAREHDWAAVWQAHGRVRLRVACTTWNVLLRDSLLSDVLRGTKAVLLILLGAHLWLAAFAFATAAAGQRPDQKYA